MNEKSGLPFSTCAKVLEDILDIIKENLAREEAVKIVRFGRFSVQTKRARRGRNPQTGAQLTIPEHKVLLFKPSKLLKDIL